LLRHYRKVYRVRSTKRSDGPIRGEVVWTRCLRSFDGDANAAQRAASLLSRFVAAAALLLIAATWPLWTSQAAFPGVPFFGALRGVPAWLEGISLAAACIALVGALVAGSRRRIGRWSLLLYAGVVACLVLADQHRLQPWAYQLSLLALILAVLPPPEAIAWARLLVVSIYFYSAVSKLDWTFFESGGGQIVGGLWTFLHVNHEQVEPSQRLMAGSLALGELLVAAGLCWRSTRRAALLASAAMHLMLLAALGPWGAGHKPGVLLWNLYFIAQNIVLFGVAGEWKQPAEISFPPPVNSPAVSTVRPAFRVATRGLIAFAALFPLTEPFGICDVWPAWAVYATGPERLRVYINAADIERLPTAVRPYVDAPRFLDGRCLVRIDRWSLEATQAPLYPQNRFRLGVALALAQVAGLEESIHVEIDRPANRWTGRRSSQTLTGSAAITAELDRDWLNGLPRPFAEHSIP
jgi:hypothetical protein